MSTSGGTDVVGAAPSAWNDAVGSPFTLGNGGSTGTLDTNALGRDVAIHVTANASANTLTWEASEDGANWAAFQLFGVSGGAGAGSGSSSSGVGIILAGRVPARFMRVRVSAFVAGTTTFALGFHASPSVPSSINVDTELPAAAALSDAAANPTAPVVGAFGALWNGSTWNRQQSAQNSADASNGSGLTGVGESVFNGASWDRRRGANTFKMASAAALGSTALWTPAAGKKFRLMGFRIVIPNNAALAVAGVEIVQLFDAAAGLPFITDVLMPNAAAATPVGGYDTGWIDLGNGYLSAAANNILNINLNTAMAAGYVRVMAAGTEE